MKFNPADTKPKEPGVYRVRDEDGIVSYSWWDGEGFGFRGISFYEAHECRNVPTGLPARTEWAEVAS